MLRGGWAGAGSGGVKNEHRKRYLARLTNGNDLIASLSDGMTPIQKGKKMIAEPLVEIDEQTPLLLRRAEKKSLISEQGLGLSASHFTMVTTSGNDPEMGDQEEDSTRYDRD